MSDILHVFGRQFAILAIAFSTVAPAAVEAAPHVNFPWLRDMQVTVYARRALMDDPVLARLNLGVNVRDGIATVWGPVPDDRIAKQAVKKVERAKGVLQVRNDLYVLAPKPEEELIDLPFVFDTPTKSESASPNRLSGKIDNLMGRFNPLAAEDDSMMTLHAGVSLLPPVAVSEAPAPPAAPMPTPVIAGEKEPIALAIDRLRADERFRTIATELKDKTVLLRGGSARGEHVMAFAQAISHLPGVERVVVNNNP